LKFEELGLEVCVLMNEESMRSVYWMHNEQIITEYNREKDNH